MLDPCEENVELQPGQTYTVPAEIEGEKERAGQPVTTLRALKALLTTNPPLHRNNVAKIETPWRSALTNQRRPSVSRSKSLKWVCVVVGYSRSKPRDAFYYTPSTGMNAV